MRNRVEYVSIDLRNLDGVILEDESDKENGGDGSRNATGPAVEDILQIHDKAMNRWNTLFIIVCATSVFIDPLFCYIHVVKEDYMCFTYDLKLFWTYICLRSGGDVFYLIDIIIFLGGICKKRKGKIYGVFWKPSSGKKRVLP
ncbi:PREDICTED: cyclic nucleotide-gated ion channel 1-like [Fragaria vesca subsp. vesca]